MTKRNSGNVRYPGQGQLTKPELDKIRMNAKLGIEDTIRLFGEDWDWYVDVFSKCLRKELREVASQVSDNDVTFKQEKEVEKLYEKGRKRQY